MIFTTLGEAITELRPRINGGTCVRSTAVSRINQATRRILNRPRKPVHIERITRFFTYKDTITLPREVEKVMHCAIDGRPSQVVGRSYEFVSGGWGELACGDCMPGRYLVDMGNNFSTMFDLPSLEADDPRCEPEFGSFRLAAFSTSPADANLELVIHGRNEKNESLGSPLPGMRLGIHPWDGAEGTLRLDTASAPSTDFPLSDPVRDVEQVAKPVTAGFVSLYTFNPVTYQMYFLAKYHPTETNPRYRRYRITTPDHDNGQSVYALCELGYVPLDHDDDILIVQNLDALKMMVMAIEFENEREFQAAKAYEADAYRLIEDQRGSERTHEYNALQVSPAWGFGDVRAR